MSTVTDDLTWMDECEDIGPYSMQGPTTEHDFSHPAPNEWKETVDGSRV